MKAHSATPILKHLLQIKRFSIFLAAFVLVGALTVGFMGGFTTMSSFAFETVSLIQGRAYLAAGTNVLVSVGVCLVGCAAGLAVGRAIAR